MTPASQPNQQPVTINAPIQSLQQQSNTNVTKSFSATGSKWEHILHFTILV